MACQAIGVAVGQGSSCRVVVVCSLFMGQLLECSYLAGEGQEWSLAGMVESRPTTKKKGGGTGRVYVCYQYRVFSLG